MPTLTINGRSVTVGDEFLSLSPEQQDDTVDEIAASMGGASQPEATPKIPQTNMSDAAREFASFASNATQNPQVAAPAYDGGTFDALTEGSHAGAFFGYDDELGAAFNAPFHAAADWYQGRGFDVGDAYTRLQKQLEGRKEGRREAHPIASLTGEVAGGLALGNPGTQAVTKVLPAGKVTTAAAEGALYGGLYGSGEAKPGERLEGAATGAGIGALTGGVLQGVGNKIATRGAQKAANAATPSSDELGGAAQQLYRASEAEGVMLKAPAIQRLGANMKVAAGRVNDKLRPKTAGFVDDIDDMVSGDMTLEAFDELRKSLNAELKTASPDDARTLTSMKRVVDAFSDNLQPSSFTGDAQRAVGFLKQARETWAKKAKTETIEKILDMAEVNGAGKYTQSGFANAVRQEMRALYKSIQKGREKGWTKEEIALIRQMAQGGSNSKIVNLFAKFAPRGVGSIAAGQFVGSALPGMGNILMPMAGHIAGEAADRGAMAAAQALRTGAATGTVPRVPRQLAQGVAPFIGGATAANMGVPRLLEPSPRR
jgi:hypothetical protein